MRVLVVSQDAGLRQRVASGLRGDDAIEIVEAIGAHEAHDAVLATLEERSPTEPFGVLIVDGDLDPEGGYSMLYELRAAAQLRGEDLAPSIVLMARPADNFLGDWSGATVKLMKPTDPFEVARAVRGFAPAAAE